MRYITAAHTRYRACAERNVSSHCYICPFAERNASSHCYICPFGNLFTKFNYRDTNE